MHIVRDKEKETSLLKLKNAIKNKKTEELKGILDSVNKEFFEYLLPNKQNNKEDNKLCELLSEAIKNSYDDGVITILQASAKHDVFIKTMDPEWTLPLPLALMAKKNKLDLIEKVLSLAADNNNLATLLNIESQSGRILDEASKNNYLPAMELILDKAGEAGQLLDVLTNYVYCYSLPITYAFQWHNRDAVTTMLKMASKYKILYETIAVNHHHTASFLLQAFDEEGSFSDTNRDYTRKFAKYKIGQAADDILEIAKNDEKFVDLYAKAIQASLKDQFSDRLEQIINTAKEEGKLTDILSYKVDTNYFGSFLTSEKPEKISVFTWMALSKNKKAFSTMLEKIDTETLEQILGSTTSIRDVLLGAKDHESVTEFITEVKSYVPQISDSLDQTINHQMASIQSAREQLAIQTLNAEKSAFIEDIISQTSGLLIAKTALSPAINYLENHIKGIEQPSLTTYYLKNFEQLFSIKAMSQQAIATATFALSHSNGNSLVNSWLSAKIAADSVSLTDGSFNKNIYEYAAELTAYIPKMIMSTVINNQYVLPHYNEAKITTMSIASVMPELVSLAGNILYIEANALYQYLSEPSY